MIDVNGRIIINLDVCTDDFTKARISNSPAVLTHPYVFVYCNVHFGVHSPTAGVRIPYRVERLAQW